MTKKSHVVTVVTSGKKIAPQKISAEVVAKSLEKQALPIIRKLSEFKLRTADDRDKAIELTKDLKGIAKEAERQLGTIINPIKQSIDAARAIFKPFQDQVKNLDAEIKQRILDFDQKQSDKKVALEERYEKGKVSTASFLKKTSELEADNGMRMVWQAIPVNVDATPREYLVPDETKIKQALKEGKKVKGWKWEQVKTIAI